MKRYRLYLTILLDLEVRYKLQEMLEGIRIEDNDVVS